MYEEGVHITLYSQQRQLKFLVLIGVSTGGPKALQYLFSHLTARKDTALLVVQHMPPNFTYSLAKRLNELSSYSVKEAKHGDPIKGAHAYVAPGDYHLEIRMEAGTPVVYLTKKAPRKGHRPAVDVLFESAVQAVGYSVITVIMTGMGKDGTEGLKWLKEQKHIYSLAEDESSCIVYGMPKTAIEAGLVDKVVPLEGMPGAIEQAIKELGGA
ncbi:two-component system chemotaxis response regulator CheB [Caldalkalibacillus uzonensis]|uniref:protein-glutamate methylesterase n=1 Tax=Caldalkalibacillus uzonensis TaxID=353224 RepID=A0ABU0CLJ3_9BACI|nr:CheB methylesterase domain-containing protein [Caldalkalibacillus uzonensis]MDQ0337283.1 two-component system chemotaxis response regulator CheB [Caldalkalibacillus uzonensis]